MRAASSSGRPASTRACSVIARPPGRISTVALWTSITPATRSAAATTRSLGRSSAASGSACTETSAGPPSSCSTTRSTSSMTAWLRSRPASRSTPITTSAKYLPPEERTRSARTSVTPGIEATTARRFASAPAGRAVHERVDVGAREPHGAEHDEAGDEERGDGVGARMAERRQPEPDHDRERAREVGGEVHRVGAQRRAAHAARDARRRRRPRGVDHEHEAEHRGRRTRSRAPRPRRRRGAGSADTAIHAGREHEDRGLAQRREVLRLAVPVRMLVIGRPVGDADGVQREQRRARVDARVHGLGEDPEAAGEEADEQLDADEGQRRAEREERGAPCHRHQRDRTRPVPSGYADGREHGGDDPPGACARTRATSRRSSPPSASTSRPGTRAASRASSRARGSGARLTARRARPRRRHRLPLPDPRGRRARRRGRASATSCAARSRARTSATGSRASAAAAASRPQPSPRSASSRSASSSCTASRPARCCTTSARRSCSTATASSRSASRPDYLRIAGSWCDHVLFQRIAESRRDAARQGGSGPQDLVACGPAVARYWTRMRGHLQQNCRIVLKSRVFSAMVRGRRSDAPPLCQTSSAASKSSNVTARSTWRSAIERAAATCDREIGIALAEAGELEPALLRLDDAREALAAGNRPGRRRDLRPLPRHRAGAPRPRARGAAAARAGPQRLRGAAPLPRGRRLRGAHRLRPAGARPAGRGGRAPEPRARRCTTRPAAPITSRPARPD